MSTPLHHLLFPGLKDRRWGYVNFGEESFVKDAAIKVLEDAGLHWAEALHKRLGIEFSFGGYMEDRSHLMRDHYQKPGETWHLGIDYTVPSGTEVHLPFNAELVYFQVDPDQNGGWGGKAIFSPNKKDCLIFGHLNEIESRKTQWNAGDRISTIADFSKNGGWFPHLHIQVVANSAPSPFLVDGYNALYLGIDRDFPRPDVFIEELNKRKS